MGIVSGLLTMIDCMARSNLVDQTKFKNFETNASYH
jgi:hypothetical protein